MPCGRLSLVLFYRFSRSHLSVGGRLGYTVPYSKTMTNPTQQPVKIKPLKDAFKGKFLIGATLSNAALSGNAPQELAIGTTHFNAFTPENCLKPEAVQPVEGRFEFGLGDQLVAAASKSKATAIGHCLVWHSQTPRWFFTGPDGKPASRELALQRMRTHIGTVVGHYKGKIKQWDVVNEAINDGPGILRPSPWLQAIGEDYIAEAFRAAHQADP
jgi:endo-1,4-beta-xylanase